jgi:hypothetical protein
MVEERHWGKDRETTTHRKVRGRGRVTAERLVQHQHIGVDRSATRTARSSVCTASQQHVHYPGCCSSLLSLSLSESDPLFSSFSSFFSSSVFLSSTLVLSPVGQQKSTKENITFEYGEAVSSNMDTCIYERARSVLMQAQQSSTAWIGVQRKHPTVHNKRATWLGVQHHWTAWQWCALRPAGCGDLHHCFWRHQKTLRLFQS